MEVGALKFVLVATPVIDQHGHRTGTVVEWRNVTMEKAVESTIVETRQYAKRQRTWFRRDSEIHWLHGFGDDPEILVQATQADINALRGA